MVDEHLLGFGERYRLLQAVDAVERIEVETENELGLGYQFFGKLGIARIDDNLFRTFRKSRFLGNRSGTTTFTSSVDIDMVAGPSEILIVADDSANPAFWPPT